MGTALLVVGILDFSHTRVAWERSISSQQIEFGTKVMDEIDRFLYERYLDMLTIGEDDIFEQFLEEGGDVDSSINDRIHELAEFSGPWETLFAVNLDGFIVASTIEDDIGKNIEAESNNYETFKLSKTEISGIYYSDIGISDDTGKPVISFGVPVRSEKTAGKPIIGIIIGHLALQTIQDIVQNIETETELNLYTRDGKMIATNQESPENLFIIEPEILTLIKEAHSEERPIIHVGSDIEEVYEEELRAVVPSLGHLEYKGNDWVLVAEESTESVFAPAREQAMRTLILFVIGFLIALISIFFFFKRFVISPIVSLTLFSKAVAAGDLSQRIKIASKDEFGELASSFNEMAGKLNESYESLEEVVAERTRELNQKLIDVEKLNQLMVDRELRMVELKKENSELKEKLDQT